jgi:fibronectin-binding autotransporter adhesin
LTVGNHNASSTFGGEIYGSSNLSLTKIGSGAIVLTGYLRNNGPVTVNGGTLALLGANASYTSLTANNGGTLLLRGVTYSLGAIAVRAATGGNVQYQNATLYNGILRGPGTHTFQAGSTNSLNSTVINPATVIMQYGNDTLFNVRNRGQIASNGYLTLNSGNNDGGSVLTVNGTADVSEWINAGVITINNGGVLNNHLSNLTNYGGARVTINSGGTLNADSQSDGVTLDLQDSLLVNNGTVTGTTNVYYGATVSGSGSFGLLNVLSGGVLALSPSASLETGSVVLTDGIISGGGENALSATMHGASQVVPDAANPLELSGALSGDGSLTKLGDGLLILSGSNSYTGGTTVDAGTLIAANDNAIADGTNLTVGNTAYFAPVVPSLAVSYPPASTPVPEPGTSAMLTVAAAIVLLYRKRQNHLRQ